MCAEKDKFRTTLIICLIMILFVIGEFPTTLSMAFEMFGTDSQNEFVQWLGFSNTGLCFTNIVVVASYLLNIWVYVVVSKQFRENLLHIFDC